MGREHYLGADPRIDFFTTGGHQQSPGPIVDIALRDHPGGACDVIAEFAMLDDERMGRHRLRFPLRRGIRADHGETAVPRGTVSPSGARDRVSSAYNNCSMVMGSDRIRRPVAW